MAFTKETWVQGALPSVTGAELNRIEQGIADAHAVTWANLALGPNWTTQAGEEVPQYAKLANSLVVLRGLVVLGASGYATLLGTLPNGQGVRPAKTQRFPALTYNGGSNSWGMAYIAVGADGSIAHAIQVNGVQPATAGSWVSFGISLIPGDGS